MILDMHLSQIELKIISKSKLYIIITTFDVSVLTQADYFIYSRHKNNCQKM